MCRYSTKLIQALIAMLCECAVLMVPRGLGAQEPQTLTLRILPTPDKAMQARLFSALAKYAETVRLEIMPGRSVDDAVRQHCGFVSAPLRAAMMHVNKGLGFQAQAQARTVDLPPCPYRRFEGTVGVSTIGTLPRLLLLKTGFAGSDTIKQVALRNPSLVDQDGRLLGTRGTLVLPYQAKAFTLYLRANVGPPQKVALALARSFPTLMRGSFVANYVKGGGDAVFAIDKVIAASSTAGGGCSGRESAWPFDSERVAAALAATEKLADSSTSYPKAVVLVVDTGLRETDGPRFPLWRNPGETGPHARRGVDNDRNDYVDDINGANMNRDAGFPAAVEAFSDADHGTQVSGIMIGPWVGPRLRAMLLNRMSLAMVNVVDTEVAGVAKDGAPRFYVHIPPSGVEHAFDYADRMRPVPPAVLNISLASRSPYPMIGKYLHGARYLTVMAVGNDGEQIDLVNKACYPVEYRRTSKDVVLTVAAHAGDGKFAAFSNYGRSVVDLAAPGCALETQRFDGERVTSSGTSLAAPLVSLTAALLYSEGVVNPTEIRNRILTTTDFDTLLKPRVYSSGRLNIEKALRIFQDIVVSLRADGTPDEPEFGELSVKEPMAICGDQMSLRNVLKIIPRYQDGPEPMLVLRRMGSESGNVQHCAAASDIELEFREEGGKPPRAFKLTDLHELIPAVR